jgi:hypothetical protein
MLSFALFLLSGIAIVALTLSKRVEERKKTKVFILRAVSRADERVREFHHEALHFYSEGKDRFSFWAQKQLPMKLKSLYNRFQAYAEEKSIEYLGDVRNSRLIKRSDGISEFFKNISDIEKGTGEINEVLPEEMQHDFYVETAPKPIEVTETRVETVITTTVEEEPVHIVSEVVEAPVTISPKLHKQKKAAAPKKRPAAPRKKRVKVLEIQHETI